jgi:hypothetical protein
MNRFTHPIAVIVAALMGSAVNAAEESSTGFDAVNRARVEYDDNIREGTSDKEDSIKIIEELELMYNINTEATLLGLRYMPSFVWYENRDEDETDFHHQFDASLRQSLSDSLSFSLKDVFRRAELPELIEGTGVVRENNDYNYNSVNAALDMDISPTLTLKGEGRHIFLAYDDDQVADVSDYDQVVGGLSLISSLDARSLLAGEATYDSTDYEDGVRSYASTQVGLSLERQISESSFFSVRGGYEFRTFDEDGIDDANSPYVSGGLGFNASAETKLNLGVGYYLAQTPTSSFASQEKTVFSVGVDQALSADLSLNVAASYALGTYDGDYATSAAGADTDLDAEDKVIRVGARLAYVVNPANTVEVGWQYVDYDTDLSGAGEGTSESLGLRDYERNRLSLGWKTRL